MPNWFIVSRQQSLEVIQGWLITELDAGSREVGKLDGCGNFYDRN